MFLSCPVKEPCNFVVNVFLKIGWTRRAEMLKKVNSSVTQQRERKKKCKNAETGNSFCVCGGHYVKMEIEYEPV